MSLWLYIPTTLLFWGRTGNAAVFTQAMINRMFQVTDNMGMREIPVFILLYALVVFVSFLYVPKNKKTVFQNTALKFRNPDIIKI